MAGLHVSASALRLLIEGCARAWSYRYLAGHEPEDLGAPLVLGRAMHAALAVWFEHLRDGEEAGVDELRAAATAVIDEAEGGTVAIVINEDTPDLRAEVDRLLDAFMVAPYRPHRILAVERPFSLTVAHHPSTGECFDFEEVVSGVWDLVVEEADGTIAVVDHKVGKRAPTIEGGFDLQMALYAWAAEQVFKPAVPVRLYHHVLARMKVPKIALRPLGRTPHDVEEAIEAVVAGVALIHVAVGHPTPARLLGRRRSWRCGGCQHRRRCDEDRS